MFAKDEKLLILHVLYIQTDESEIGSVAAEAASKIDDLIRHDNGDEEIEDVDEIDAITGVAIVSNLI